MTRICKLFSISVCVSGLLVAQDKPVKPAPFGPVTLPDTDALYQQLLRSNLEGIGKFYMGRQISHVMGHAGATWLERPEREKEENTDEMIKCLKLKRGYKVADIGVGTGYIARRMAKKIGDDGVVLGVDIEQKMLDDLKNNMKAAGVTNVKGHLGTISDPKLEERSLDFVIMVDVYHEFSHPYEMMSGIVKALKPGGQVAFVEYRAEDPKVPIKRLHKMTEEQVLKEASLFPLKHVETYKKLPWQHVVFFEKTEVKKK